MPDPLAVLLMLGCGLLAVEPPDRASPSMELGWDAPGECPHRDQVEAEVARLLTGLDAPQHPVRADVRVRGTGGSYHLDLRLTVDEQEGERGFDGATCEELVDAVALTIAIAVDPRALERAIGTDGGAESTDGTSPALDEAVDEPASEPDEASEDDAERTIVGEPAPFEDPPRPRPRSEHRIALATSGGLGFGPLPTVAGLVGLELAYLGERWRLGIVGSFWFPTAVNNPNAAAVGGRFLLGTAGLRGCFIPSTGATITVPLCLGADAGAVRGEGYGQLDARTARSPYLALRAGPGLTIAPIRAFALTLAVDGLVPLIRPAFETEPSGLVYRATPAGFQVALGLEWRVPTRRRASEH